MKVVFDKSFSKSIDKLKNKNTSHRVIKFIIRCENAKSINDIPSIKKFP